MQGHLPLKESSRELIVEVARALEPYFPDISTEWRERLKSEFGFDGRIISALDRLTMGTGCGYFLHDNFNGFFENVNYFGVRLSKLQVDIRAVSSALEIYMELCEPYLGGLFGERQQEARAVLEMLSSSTFVAVSGRYFDHQTKESTAVLRVLDAELASEDLTGLLSSVLEITTATYGASFGVVLLREGRDSDEDLLRVCAAVGVQEIPEDFKVPLGAGFSGQIAASGEPRMMLDASTDSSILLPLLKSRVRSMWGMPLKNEHAVIGVLLIGFNKPYEWLPRERELMHAIAERSALAIERARFTEALRDREARIAELSGHLLSAQDEERKRISRELHDETGQALMVIRLYLGMLEQQVTSRGSKSKIRETVDVVDRTIEGIRRIIGKLSPLMLQELGLVAAIRKEAKDLAKNTGVRGRVAIADDVGRFSPERETAIYRVVQEALHNVAKHAHAKSVNIAMTLENGMARLVVEDDGVGMAVNAGSPLGHSFGLAGIKERIGMLGGTMEVTSELGRGTKVEVLVPVNGTAGIQPNAVSPESPDLGEPEYKAS